MAALRFQVACELAVPEEASTSNTRTTTRMIPRMLMRYLLPVVMERKSRGFGYELARASACRAVGVRREGEEEGAASAEGLPRRGFVRVEADPGSRHRCRSVRGHPAGLTSAATRGVGALRCLKWSPGREVCGATLARRM